MAAHAPLYCDRCHTKWVETVWMAWHKCPFVDCGGTLRARLPGPPPPPPRKRQAPTFPLLDAIRKQP